MAAKRRKRLVLDARSLDPSKLIPALARAGFARAVRRELLGVLPTLAGLAPADAVSVVMARGEGVFARCSTTMTKREALAVVGEVFDAMMAEKRCTLRLDTPADVAAFVGQVYRALDLAPRSPTSSC